MNEKGFSKDAERFSGMDSYTIECIKSNEKMRYQIAARIHHRTGLTYKVIKNAGKKIGYINLLGKSKEEIEQI